MLRRFMIDSLDDFLNHLKTETRAQSDRQLAFKFDLAQQTIYAYRTGRAKPSDDTMLAMAKRAGIDPDEALLMLNIWRTEGAAKSRYETMLKSLKKFTALSAVLAAACFAPVGRNAQALDNYNVLGETTVNLASHKGADNILNLYIMRF